MGAKDIFVMLFYESENVTLFRTRVIAFVIKLRILR